MSLSVGVCGIVAGHVVDKYYVKPFELTFRDKSALYGKSPQERGEPSW